MSTSIGEEVKAIRKLNPSWSFEQSWNHVMALKPELEAGSAESNRVAAKLAPDKEKEARAKFEHIEVIAKRLMERNRSLTFGAALEITRTCLPGVQAEIADLLRPKSKELEPRELVEAGDEQEERAPHPGQAAAIAKGLLLIEGGFCTPLHGKNKGAVFD